MKQFFYNIVYINIMYRFIGYDHDLRYAAGCPRRCDEVIREPTPLKYTTTMLPEEENRISTAIRRKKRRAKDQRKSCKP